MGVELHNIVLACKFYSWSDRILKSMRREDDGFALLSYCYCLISWKTTRFHIAHCNSATNTTNKIDKHNGS